MQPDSLGPVLHKYVLSAVELYESNEKFTTKNIVPVIKPVRYLEDMKKMGAEVGVKQGFEGAYEIYNPQLVIVYAEDTQNGIKYFSDDFLKTRGITKDSLRPIATRNMYRLLPDIQVRGGDGIYMITAGGNYEASILLLAFLVVMYF